MAKKEVQFAQIKWITVTVDVPDDVSEDEILNAAYDALPETTAYECGWGSEGWSADVDEPMTIDLFTTDVLGKVYNENLYGAVIRDADE